MKKLMWTMLPLVIITLLGMTLASPRPAEHIRYQPVRRW